ncbi:MAG: hypothetical protein ACMUIA_06770 [bacterium]
MIFNDDQSSGTKPRSTNAFHSLFGTDAAALRRICVLAPFSSREMLKGFKMERCAGGALYSVGDNGLFSLVVTRMGAPFLGDAVLHLEHTPCEYLILFGSCGAVDGKGFEPGSLAVIETAYSQDSFVNMLFQRKCDSVYYPDEEFLRRFLSCQKEYPLKRATCLTVGSLKLEEQYLSALQHDSTSTDHHDSTAHHDAIDVVDMETSAFYAASGHTHKKALSFLLVTDILTKFPYYLAMGAENRKLLRQFTARASEILFELITHMAVSSQIPF